jgi:hypothetical protein
MRRVAGVVDTGRIDFELVGIGSLLKDRSLGVPIYQRSYSWQEDQIQDFWSDLRSAFAKSDPEYFLGTIVLTAEGLAERHAVIDGQQRLATTAMLLAAVREEYKERGDDRDAIIQASYLADRDLESGDVSPHLTLNSDDDSFFRALIVSGDDPSAIATSKKSHDYLKEGYEQLRTYVKATAEDAGSEWPKKLSAWVAYVRDRVRVIVVDVPSEADAFLIFETLNDRGADLTIADLLKNYLFGKAGRRLDEVRDGWMQALGALDLASEASLFTVFLRHYWSSKHGATRERELYKSIKEEVTNETGAVALVKELQKAAALYSAIQSSDHDFWAKMGTATRNNVETLLRLELEQHRPLLLAAMQHFTEAELKKLLRSLVAWSVRGLISGGIGGGTTERAFCEAAMKIRDGSAKTTADLRNELTSIIATDDEFERAFSIARVPKASLARYYLLTLERQASGESEPELIANDDEERVNLEHILPKTARQADWPQFSEDDAKAFVHRLGNLALLSKGPNGRIGNKPWAVKKPVLLKSQLRLTKAAGQETDWTKRVIQDRQVALARDAVKAWPR